MKLKNPRIDLVYGEGARISFLLADKESEAEARRFVDKDREKSMVYDAAIKEDRKKRSLTANAYFHVLCTKIAAALKTDIESVKKQMVRSYGAYADNDAGDPIIVTVPKGINIELYFNYPQWMYGDEKGDTYMIFKPTHCMNTAEFARLIDATVDEAKALGIETLPPSELERLYAQIDSSM